MPIDAEDLAALIDGRLGGSGFRDVVADLLASEDGLEIAADALAVTWEIHRDNPT